MPQGTDYFGLPSAKEAMGLMVPLVVNKRRLKMEEDQLAQRTAADAERIKIEQQKIDDAATTKMQEWKFRSLLSAAEQFMKSGDTDNLQKLAPQFEQFGVNLGSLGPLAQKPTKEDLPNTLEEVLARSAKTPEEALKLKQQLTEHAEKTKEKYRTKTAEEKMPPEVKWADGVIKKFEARRESNLLLGALAQNAPVGSPLHAMFTTQQQELNSSEVVEELKRAHMIVGAWSKGKMPPAATTGDNDPLGLRKK